MKESDIVYENGSHWVAKQKHGYTVFKPYSGVTVTASESDCTFGLTDDGLSLAIYRANYLEKRMIERAS